METRTAGSESGLEKRTSGNAGTALQADSPSQMAGMPSPAPDHDQPLPKVDSDGAMPEFVVQLSGKSIRWPNIRATSEQPEDPLVVVNRPRAPPGSPDRGRIGIWDVVAATG